MTRRLVDLSVLLENNPAADPEGLDPKITYVRHEETAEHMGMMVPGLKPEQLPDGQGYAIERMEVTTHNGTHVDAPWHYHSTMDNGRRAITIDEVPLDWCLQPAVKLDFRHLPDGHVVRAAEIEAELERIGHRLQPLDIVVVNTAAGERYGEADYLQRGCGMGREATLYLAGRGVRMMGTDAWSWDAPAFHMARKFAETGDASLIFEGHKAGRECCYCHMEKLHNLEKLPSSGFTIACFPVNVKGGSAGWTRAVAIFDD